MLDPAEFEFYLNEGEEAPPFQHELLVEFDGAYLAMNMAVTLEAIEASTPDFTSQAAWYLQYDCPDRSIYTISSDTKVVS